MSHCADSTHMSPDQRRRELVHILATGVLRLRKLRLLAGEPAETPQDSSAESAVGRLEVSGETVLSVTTG